MVLRSQVMKKYNAFINDSIIATMSDYAYWSAYLGWSI